MHACYERIAALDRPGVWISLRREHEALELADDVDRRVADGVPLPLAGLTVAVKGNIDLAGLPTTAACPDVAVVPARSAPAVQRLVDAGAVVLGTTNLDQFATGLVGTRSPYGTPGCAWDPDRIPGGSSSGSAVAVALGMVDVALGTDTAGSGRVPAAYHDLIGMKPTRGLVPTLGVVPACADYDVVTTFTRSVAVASQLLSLLVGADRADPRSRTWPADIPLAAPPDPVLAVPREADLAPLSPEYRGAFEATVDALHAQGLRTRTVDISALLDAARLLYDGAIVAQRYAAVGELLETAPPSADPTVAAIILGARDVRAADYVADLERLAVARGAALELLDGAALVVPTTTEHPSIAAVRADPLGINRRLGTYTNFCNLLDLCAIAVPGAPTRSGHPFGITVIARDFADQVVLDLGARIVGEPEPGCVADVGVTLAVFGAHLRGQPLNAQLVELGARFVETVRTSDAYRLVALDTVPPKPGLVRHGAGLGAQIGGELWRLTPHALGRLCADLPAPMSLTEVELADGRDVTGFGCSHDAALAGRDITAHGGWVEYLHSRS